MIENAPKGDAALINGILGHQFVDDNRKTREAASKILLVIAVPGDPDVVNILEELLSRCGVSNPKPQTLNIIEELLSRCGMSICKSEFPDCRTGVPRCLVSCQILLFEES